MKNTNERESNWDATHILEAHDAIADDDARVTMVYDFSETIEQTGGT